MIVVAGEALVDLIVRPDGALAPVAGGGPYNAARAIARLGVPAAWAGGLSSDRFGRMLEAGLAADGVSLALAQRTDRPTTLALAELDAHGAATYRFYAAGTSAPQLLAGPLAGGLPAGTRALHVGTLGLVLEPMATTLEGLVAALPDEVLLMVDPNCRPSITPDPAAYRARIARVLARADVVQVSGDDLAFLVPGAAPADAVRRIRDHGPAVVLHTNGGRPVTVHVGEDVRTVPVLPVRVVDTVGAGDTFGGAFLACLVHDRRACAALGADRDVDGILRAVRFAVRAAGIACERTGAEPPRLADVGGWPAS